MDVCPTTAKIKLLQGMRVYGNQTKC